MDPSTQSLVGGVIDMLEDNAWRGHHKFSLFRYDPTMGLEEWAVVEGRVWVSFVEGGAGILWVAHVSIQSNFRPPRHPLW